MGYRPIIGISMGDPAGNGPEITVKALNNREIYDRCRPIMIGDAKMLEQAKKYVNLPNIKINQKHNLIQVQLTYIS